MPFKKVGQTNPLFYFRQVVAIYFRRRNALGYLEEKRKLAKAWAWKRTEFSNYYYSLTERNRKDLSFLIAYISNTPLQTVENYFSEVENDQAVATSLLNFRIKHPELRDSSLGMGRRIGWYALIRITKPRLVVETGVHHGVGALIIAAALLQNRKEGFRGEYLGTDINPNCGEVLSEPFSSICSIIIGDSVETLRKVETDIDFFINDSDHNWLYELEEYNAIESNLSEGAIILGDNCHASDALRKFSEKKNRHFLFFKEEPLDHFYYGAGIGVSFRKD